MNTISNTVNMTVRIDKELKDNVDILFKTLGTNTNSAINMFLRQCDREQSLVFTPALAPEPSRKLKKALKEGEKILSGKKRAKSYTDMEELMRDLES